MIYLLIDNSNTRTKLTLANETGILDWRAVIATKEVGPEILKEALEGRSFDAAVISSVVPTVRTLLEEWLQSLSIPYHLITYTSPIGIAINYPNPAQIGADRLANAAAVAVRYPTPCIVVDFGTAVTFDVIDDVPAYVGGVIAPGLAALSNYLAHKTALLPTIDPHEPECAIGKSTEDAMHAGAVYGYRGLVKEILAKLEAELPSRPYVVATGGDARLIARGVPRIDRVDTKVTLNGLLAVAKKVFPCS